MKYTYKDIVTGKMRWTRGKFSGWQRGGLLNARYAVFQNPHGAVLVPEYYLTPGTKAEIRAIEAIDRKLKHLTTNHDGGTINP